VLPCHLAGEVVKNVAGEVLDASAGAADEVVMPLGCAGELEMRAVAESCLLDDAGVAELVEDAVRGGAVEGRMAGSCGAPDVVGGEVAVAVAVTEKVEDGLTLWRAAQPGAAQQGVGRGRGGHDRFDHRIAMANVVLAGEAEMLEDVGHAGLVGRSAGGVGGGEHLGAGMTDGDTAPGRLQHLDVVGGVAHRHGAAQ
jgi:hypothetical protein